jgi:hypothetical protein
MMRYILVVVAMLGGLAGVGYVSQNFKASYGVFEGMAIVYEGNYYLIEGDAYRSPVNATILKGKFILWGGYLINGTEVKPNRVTAAVVTGNVVVVVGTIEVLVGEVHRIGNYTVVTGNPARVLIVDGYLFHPK